MRLLQPGAEAEIRQLDVALCVDEQVVWFDVAMNEPEFVYRVDGEYRLGHVKTSLLIGQGIFVHQKRHHVT